MPRNLVEAHERATALLAQAKAEAERVLQAARAGADAERQALLGAARAEARSELADVQLRLRAAETHADERALDRSVALARVLAERLLGRSLSLEPSLIVDLAQQALREAGGARRIAVSVHPQHLPELRAALSAGTLEHVTALHGDEALSAGSFVLESELGRLEADLGTQLDRLTERLRGAVRER